MRTLLNKVNGGRSENHINIKKYIIYYYIFISLGNEQNLFWFFFKYTILIITYMV